MDNYIGEIRMFGGKSCPEYWGFANGQPLDISQYNALYALYGVIWGGDGQTNFKLPDMRSRLPVGQGTGTGLTARSLAQSFGVEAVALTEAQMPIHSHPFQATTAAATSNNPVGNLLAVPDVAGAKFYAPASTNVGAMAPTSLSTIGSGQTHSNMMQSIGLNFIVALNGIFPSQS